MKKRYLVLMALLASIGFCACQKECKPGQDLDCWIGALKNPEQQEKALDNVRDLNDRRAEPALIELFKNSEDKPEVREKIAEIFHKWGTREAVDALLQALDFSAGPSSESRKAKRLNLMNQKIASALGTLGDARAAQPLLRLLKVARAGEVQRAAIRALAKLKAKEAVEDLLKLSEDTTVDRIVRMNAIFALGEIGDPRAVDSLVVSLYRDKAFYFFQAGLALVKIGEPSIPALVKAMNGNNLEIKQMLEGNPEVLEGVLEANSSKVLGDIGSPEAVQPLLDMIKKVEKWDAEMNRMVTVTRLINALGAIGDKRGLEPALKYMAKELWDVRTICATSVNNISDRGAVAAMMKFASTGSHPKTRSPIIEAIGNLGTDEILPQLQKMKESPEDPDVEKALEQSIQRLLAFRQCQASVDCWIGKLDDSNPVVKEKAAYELGRLGDEKAVDALLKIMRNENESVRFAVMFAFDRIGSRKVIPEIEKMVEEEKDSARFRVANYNYQLVAARLSRKGK